MTASTITPVAPEHEVERHETTHLAEWAVDSLEDVLSDRTRNLIQDRRSGKTRRRGWLVRRALAAADVAGLTVAFLLASLVFPPGQADQISAWTEIAVFAASLPVWILLAKFYGLYDRDEELTDHSSVDDFFGVFNMVTFGAATLYAVSWLTGLAHPTIVRIVIFWVGAIMLVAGCRAVARALCRRNDAYIQNTVIVGAGIVGQRVARKLLQHPEYGVNVLGFVDEHPRSREDGLANLTIIGEVRDLPEIVHALDVERVIVAFSQHPHTKILELIRALNQFDVQVDIVPRLFEVLGPTVRVHAAEGLPLLGLPPARWPRSNLMLKRAFDVVLSSLGLVLLAPLFAVIAVAIKLDSRGPAFFRQVRMGRGHETFRMVKFRTMHRDADALKHEVAHLNKHRGGDERMFKIASDPRATRVGRFLRRYSLDELPQLWNVLRGSMSLVGPRPLILEEARYVDGWGNRRLDLKPGITGLWQTLGRDDIPFGEMLGLDYQYVTNWSLSGDLKLIIRTLPALVGARPVR